MDRDDPQRGSDIWQLQLELNQRARARDLGQQVAVDGVYGPVTDALAHDVAYTYGAAQKFLDQAGFGEGLQRLVRFPGRRTPAQRARDQLRRKPRIITSAQLGLRFQYLWGQKGTPFRGADHYTADSRAQTGDALVEKVKVYHRLHGGGVAYEALFADDGTIVLGNPADRKGAAVAGQNSGMWNISHPGTTGDLIAPAALRSMRWYLAHAHTTQIPAAYRSPVDLRRAGFDWRGHREHPGQSTACPGDMLPQYKELHR